MKNILMATGVAALDSGLATLKNISVGVIAGIGIIILAWGIFDLATALNQHDNSQLPNSFKKIASGVLMTSCGAVLALFV